MNASALYKILIIVSFSCIVQNSLGINLSDTFIIRTLYENSDRFIQTGEFKNWPDTSLTGFHQYDPTQFVSNFYRNNGGIPSQSRAIIFLPETNPFFSTGLNFFTPYLRGDKASKVFNTTTPYFDFNYVQGSVEMQQFNAIHSRNINPFLNYTIDYQSYLQQGFYLRQKSKIKDLDINLSYFRPDSLFRIVGLYRFERVYHEENGGIVQDSLFVQFSNQARLGSDVYLSDASARYQRHSGLINLYANAGLLSKDSAKHTSPLSLFYTVRYSSGKYSYNDPSPSATYYRYFYYDSSSTRDSILLLNLGQKILLSLHPSRNEYNDLFVGTELNNYHYFQNDFDSVFYDWSFNAGGKFFLNPFAVKLFSRYLLNGYSKGSFYVSLCSDYPLNNITKLFLQFQSLKRNPGMIYSLLHSNHLYWDTTWAPVNSNSFQLGFRHSSPDMFFSLEYFRLKNYLYFDKNIQPRQIDKSFAFLKLHFGSSFYSRHFGLDIQGAYQYSPFLFELGLPEWAINTNIYFKGKLFNNKLEFYSGVDIRIQQAYYPLSYMAPFGLYYIQRDFEMPVYPIADIWLSTQVKRMRAFVKFEHINYGFPGNVLFIRPHYPFDPRTLRLGLNWMFYE